MLTVEEKTFLDYYKKLLIIVFMRLNALFSYLKSYANVRRRLTRTRLFDILEQIKI